MSTPNRVWTIEINGISRKYTQITFDRKVDMNSPTEFSATIEFSPDIHFFDSVVIKRDGISEYKGYIEGIDISWGSGGAGSISGSSGSGSAVGRYLKLKGRDASVLLWKKYVDNFGSYTENGSNTALSAIGYFGAVNPIELIKLLLRTPYSDQMFDPNNIPPSQYHDVNGNPLDIYGNIMSSYPLIEEGWGIDSSRLLCSALNTGLGDPQWTVLRRRGYGWRNGSVSPYNQDTFRVNEMISNNGWHLTGSSPYLNDPTRNSYIRSDQNIGHSAIFKFSNVPPETTQIQNVFLYFDWRGDFYAPASVFSEITVDVWIDTNGAWAKVDDLSNRGLYGDWREEIIDLSAYIKTVQDATNIRVRFSEQSTYYCTEVSNCRLAISYTILGSQNADEWFNVKILRPPNQTTSDFNTICQNKANNLEGPFQDGTTWTCPCDGSTWVYHPSTGWTKQSSLELGEYKETVCGCYIESRMDNVSYPRNFKIVTEGDIIPIIGSSPTPSYTTVGSNIISTKSDNTEIEFKSYPSEVEYNVQDYGNGGVVDFTRTFAFKIIQYQIHDYAATIFAVGDYPEDRKSMDSHNHFAVDIQGTNSGLFLRFDTFDGDSTRVTKYSQAIYPTRTYYLKIEKNVSTQSFTWYLYDSPDMKNPIYTDTSGAIYNISDRYIFNAVSYYDTSQFLQVWDYIYNTTFGFSGLSRVSSSPNVVPVIDMTRGLSKPQNGSAEFIVTMGDTKGWFERSVAAAQSLRTEFWLRVGDNPNLFSVNRDLVVDECSSPLHIGNGWSTFGYAPFLDNNHFSGGNSEVFVLNDTAYLGSMIYYFAFPNIGNPYDLWTTSKLEIHLKGNLFSGLSGHADGMSVRIYYSYDNWVTQYYVEVAGGGQFTSTSTQEKIFTLPNLTLDQINKLSTKIEFSGTSGNSGFGYGGLDLQKMWIHLEGQGYAGRIMVAKIFDDTQVQNCPNYLLFCGMGLVPNADGYWHPYLFWDDDNGQYHEVIDDTIIYPSGVPISGIENFRKFRLVVNQPSDIELWWYDPTGPVWRLIYTASPSNTTLGTPNCVCWCADCSNGALAPNGINFDQTSIDTVNNDWMTADVLIDANQRTEITLVSEVTNNTFRDLVYSWQPIAIDNLKIVITKDDDPDDLDNSGQHTGQFIRHDWCISQIYIYRADDIKYRVYLDGLTDPSTPPNTPDADYVYKGGPYIKALDLVDNYSTAVGPINIARQRLLDAILFVIGQCCLLPDAKQAYQPFEWWILPDDNNTFVVAQTRGSDKSDNVVFQTNSHIGGLERNQFINDTCQRVFMIGQGERKKQQEVSQWTENTDGEDDVRTFYEEIETEKTITDPSVSKLVGQVYTEKNAPRRDQITLTLSKDDYTTFDANDPTHGGANDTYDCGDWVKVIDTFTNIDTSYRIMNLSKKIDNNGEVVTLTLGYPKYRYEDEISTIYKQLKQFGAVGVIKPDWLADGSETKDINAYRIGSTTQFSKTAKNDTINQSINPKDPLWWVAQDDIYTRQKTFKDYETDTFTPPSISMDHDASWYCANDWMALFGATDGHHEEYVTIKGPEDDAMDSNGVPITTNFGPLYISIDRNPKVSFEIKCAESENLTWNVGDYIIIGLRNMASSLQDTTPNSNHTGNVGFWFKIIKDTNEFMMAYAQYCLIPNSAGIVDSDSNIYPKTQVPIKALVPNHKYKLEIITDTDLGIVSFNIYDIEDANNETMIASAIAPIDTLSDEEQTTRFVNPLFLEMNSTGVKSSPSNQCKVYIYKYTTEWLKVTQAS